MPHINTTVNVDKTANISPHSTKADVTRRFTEADVRAILKRSDKNNDNILDWGEISQAFKELGAMCPPYRTWRGFRHADGDGDGKISEAELKPLIDYILSLNY